MGPHDLNPSHSDSSEDQLPQQPQEQLQQPQAPQESESQQLPQPSSMDSDAEVNSLLMKSTGVDPVNRAHLIDVLQSCPKYVIGALYQLTSSDKPDFIDSCEIDNFDCQEDVEGLSNAEFNKVMKKAWKMLEERQWDVEVPYYKQNMFSKETLQDPSKESTKRLRNATIETVLKSTSEQITVVPVNPLPDQFFAGHNVLQQNILEGGKQIKRKLTDQQVRDTLYDITSQANGDDELKQILVDALKDPVVQAAIGDHGPIEDGCDLQGCVDDFDSDSYPLRCILQKIIDIFATERDYHFKSEYQRTFNLFKDGPPRV